jgi:hypothetical protein
MIKVFISHGMAGVPDIAKYVAQCRQEVSDHFAKLGKEIEIIDSYYPDFHGNRIEFIGKSIMSGMGQADVAVFMDNWVEYGGCNVEHMVAKQYGIPTLFLRRTVGACK